VEKTFLKNKRRKIKRKNTPCSVIEITVAILLFDEMKKTPSKKHRTFYENTKKKSRSGKWKKSKPNF
jgi:hypothetical protein